MKQKVFHFVICFILLFQIGCNKSKWEVDVSKSEFRMSFNRFEQDLFDVGTGGISIEEQEELKLNYIRFLPLYLDGVMSFGSPNTGNTWEKVAEFIDNKDINELFKTVEKAYPKGSLEIEAEEISNAFYRYNYHFSSKQVPQLATMISAFNYSMVTDDSLLVVGLDNYLGSDFELYPKIGVPQFKFKQFDRKFLVSDAIQAWLTTEFESEGSKNMLEQMIFQGKISFLLQALLPLKAPHLFFNYEQDELKWCEDNESQIWFHFVDMDLLYTMENFQIRKYMGDAPFISGFPEGSPGRVGQWIGFKIVDSYMRNNPKQSLKNLMELTDANRLLQESNYKPKR